MLLSKEQYKKIEKYAKQYHKKLDYAHNLDHLKKTVAIAQYIAKREKIDIEITKLCALVHQFHLNIEKLEDFLNHINFNEGIKRKLIESVKFKIYMENLVENGDYDIKKVPKIFKESKAAYDADILQILGPYGVLREIIFNITVMDKSPIESINNSRLFEQLYFKSLQTKTAKLIIKSANSLMAKFWKNYDYWENDEYNFYNA